jgi:hypothetical protein
MELLKIFEKCLLKPSSEFQILWLDDVSMFSSVDPSLVAVKMSQNLLLSGGFRRSVWFSRITGDFLSGSKSPL